MTPTTRVFDGRFGRLVFGPCPPASSESSREPRILIQFDEGASSLRLGAQPVAVSRGELVLLNPGQSGSSQPGAPEGGRMVMFQPSNDWLKERFPAVFGAREGRPFPRPVETITPRIRRLADALAIEVLNDQFLSPERLEFMLQEMMLSLVENYLATRKASSRLWQGSRFADSRIRHALALLRAQPNKEVNMDRLATAVGLSRSRFYDLFQLCTGLAPRAYLDMLCIETAVTRLASGEARISEVSAELGFSAQSNFTRFFLNRVGVAPSTYRRASARGGDPEAGETPAVRSDAPD